MNRIVTSREEIWRDVVDWPSYEVSTNGRIRTKSRPTVKGYRYKGKLITHTKIRYLKSWGNGRYVDLSQNNYTEHLSIAELVLTAFVKPRTKHKPIARHLNDITTNNALYNLAWGTRRDNRLDAVRNGRQSVGSVWAKKVSAKLKGRKRSPEVWEKIRSTRAKNGNYRWNGS